MSVVNVHSSWSSSFQSLSLSFFIFMIVTERERERQAPCREPRVGLDPRTPGSRPGPKADAQPLSPQVPLKCGFVVVYWGLWGRGMGSVEQSVNVTKVFTCGLGLK